MLTSERVKELFDYDPETGYLTRLIGIQGGSQAGDIVGRDDGEGYLHIYIDHKYYQGHRVIWLWVYGEFPKDQIDHINHNRADNRLSNLREVTQQENKKNQPMRNNNTSGVMGVGWHKRDHKWQARINVNNKQVYLGHFKEKSEAVLARKEAEKTYGFHENHGK